MTKHVSRQDGKAHMSKHKERGRALKTCHYKRDLDQVINDLEPQNFVKLTNQAICEDKPGLGQFYCVWCSKYFINDHSFKHHQASKQHKKRVKVSKEEPYTIESSLKYGGLQIDEKQK